MPQAHDCHLPAGRDWFRIVDSSLPSPEEPAPKISSKIQIRPVQIFRNNPMSIHISNIISMLLMPFKLLWLTSCTLRDLLGLLGTLACLPGYLWTRWRCPGHFRWKLCHFGCTMQMLHVAILFQLVADCGFGHLLNSCKLSSFSWKTRTLKQINKVDHFVEQQWNL